MSYALVGYRKLSEISISERRKHARGISFVQFHKHMNYKVTVRTSISRVFFQPPIKHHSSHHSQGSSIVTQCKVRSSIPIRPIPTILPPLPLVGPLVASWQSCKSGWGLCYKPTRPCCESLLPWYMHTSACVCEPSEYSRCKTSTWLFSRGCRGGWWDRHWQRHSSVACDIDGGAYRRTCIFHCNGNRLSQEPACQTTGFCFSCFAAL